MRIGDKIELRWKNMLGGIRQQVEWLAEGPRTLLEDARRLLSGPAPRQVFLVGCGDSHYAGVCARLAFERWSGIPTQALPALEFSRYVSEFLQRDSWVICVSNSGRVIRTIEAAEKARARGALSIGVTFDPESPLARATDVSLIYRYRDPGFAPGTLSYLASLVSVYALALRASELAGMEGVDELLTALEAHAAVARGTMDLAEPSIEELVTTIGSDTKIDIVGGGPNYGTALFGRAKLIEAAQARGGAHELEEWAHEEFFCTGPGTVTIALAPPGRSSDRAREQVEAARALGANTVAICPSYSLVASEADLVLPVAGEGLEELSPLLYCVPLELLAYHLGSSRGLTMLGFDDESRKRLNFRQIYGA